MAVWESLGILVHKGEVTLAMVDDFYSGTRIQSHCKLRRYVAELRSESGRDTRALHRSRPTFNTATGTQGRKSRASIQVITLALVFEPSNLWMRVKVVSVRPVFGSAFGNVAPDTRDGGGCGRRDFREPGDGSRRELRSQGVASPYAG